MCHLLQSISSYLSMKRKEYILNEMEERKKYVKYTNECYNLHTNITFPTEKSDTKHLKRTRSVKSTDIRTESKMEKNNNIIIKYRTVNYHHVQRLCS